MNNILLNLLMAACFLIGIVLVIKAGAKKGVAATRVVLNGFVCFFIVAALAFSWATRDALNSQAWFAAVGLFVVVFSMVAKWFVRRR